MTRTSSSDRVLSIFTWHVHGSYLYYLSRANIDIYIPISDPVREGYYGRGETFPFGENVIEVPPEQIREMKFDCILFQSEQNFTTDQFEILSEEQRKLPRIYLEHNAPTAHAALTQHPMNDASVTLVHVTHYNKLMWQQSVPDVCVIEHGITESGYQYTGERERGIVVINHIRERGRVTGWDLFEEVREQIPLDLVGMGTEHYGGLGEVLHSQLPAFIAKYRFFFNPIRHTSLGLSFLEAMMIGLPVVSLATTEYPTVIRHCYSGFVHNNISVLIHHMNQLLNNYDLAELLGKNGQQTVKNQFSITRFANDWVQLIESVTNNKK